jgi:hypothetical protein
LVKRPSALALDVLVRGMRAVTPISRPAIHDLVGDLMSDDEVMLGIDGGLHVIFTAGALAVIRMVKICGAKHRPWLGRLLERRSTKVAAIALANKLARMAWAMMAKGERYREPIALAR